MPIICVEIFVEILYRYDLSNVQIKRISAALLLTAQLHVLLEPCYIHPFQ